jgi:hypothetical protein
MWDLHFESMIGKRLESVCLTDDKSEIRFTFKDETIRRFCVEGDCCSESWIEHLELPDEINGSVILSISEGNDTPWDGHVCDEKVDFNRKCGHDFLSVYNQIFSTDKGNIVLEFRNNSNGYYGGYLVAIEEAGGRGKR